MQRMAALANDAVAADRQAERKSCTELMKIAPRFNLGRDPWDVYLAIFNNVADVYDTLSHQGMKKVLFNSIEGEARMLIVQELTPNGAICDAMDIVEYAEKLQSVFEPAGESEQMRLEYRARYQLPGEHVEMYFMDKNRMFNRAYNVAIRDYSAFFEDVIQGLTNHIMKEEMRRVRTTNTAAGVDEFRKELLFVSNLVRKRYCAGEISQAEALGAEALLLSNSYRTGAKSAMTRTHFKEEPINALRNGKDKSSNRCYHCNSRDHFIGQCPRKAAGMAPSVEAVQEVEDQPPETIEIDGVHYVRRPYGQGKGNPNWKRNPVHTNNPAKAGNRSQTAGKSPRKFNRRIAYVYEDENGDSHYDEELHEEEDDEQDKVEATTPGINTILAPHDLDEEDFIPAHFLGL